MTYSSTVLADSPLAYYKLNETTDTAPANSGSAGGSGTLTGDTNIGFSNTALTTLGGNAWHFNNNVGYSAQTLTFGAADYSIELWYKRDKGFADSVNNGVFAYHNGSSKNCQLAISSSGSLQASINGTFIINTAPTGVNPQDGNWHHFVVTQSGGTVTWYIDGVNRASGSGANTSSNATTGFQFGAVSGSACYLDEVALYTTALSPAKVLNHYAVGTANGTRPQVLADSPSVFFTLDESGSPFTNVGSTGGTSTNTGTITYSQTAGTTVGEGYAAKFDPATLVTNAQIGGGTLVSGTTWTYETWVKRATMTNPWVRIIGNFMNGTSYAGTNYAEIAITDDSATAVTGSVRLWDNASSTSVSFSHATIGDLNWHHVAVVNNAGSVTIYVDGTSIGTGTMTCASKTGNLVVGTRSVAGTAFYLDEPAFFTSALSASRIYSHATGTVQTPVTVTPPVINVSTTGLTVVPPPVVIHGTGVTELPPVFNVGTLNTVAPAVTAGTNVTSVVPVVSVGTISMPNATDDTDAVETVPAITMSLAQPLPVIHGGIDKSVSVPAMALSLSAPQGSKATVQYIVNYPITNDMSGKSGSLGNDQTIAAGASPAVVRTDAFTAPQGMSVVSATLNMYTQSWSAGVPSSPYVLTAYIYPDAWNESTLAATGVKPYDSATMTNVGAATIPAAQSWNSIDITSIAKQWAAGTAPNKGLGFLHEAGTSGSSGNYVYFYSHNASDTTKQPYISVQYVAAVNVTNSVPPMTLSLNEIAPGVSETASPILAVPAMVTSLAFVGGTSMNPDFAGAANPIQLSLTTPVADAQIRYPVTVAVPATYLGNMETEPATISLTTGRLIVAPVMTVNLKWVGIYTESADRYLTVTQENIQSKDIWLKLDDAPGVTTAADSAYASDSIVSKYKINTQNVGYHGGVTQRVDGPYLRKAVNFNGTNAYLGDFTSVYKYSTEPAFIPGGNFVPLPDPENDDNYAPEMTLTVEFSLRTTSLNGVIWTGWQTAGFQWNATSGPSGYDVILKDGYMHIVAPGGSGNIMFDQKVRLFLADGQWHHIVVGIPDVDNNTGPRGESYIMVDGKPVYVRSLGPIIQSSRASVLTPFSFMGRAPFKKARSASFPPDNVAAMFDASVATGCLAGDLSEVIIRPKTYLSMDQAQTIYYEWSNSTIVKPEAITLNLAAVAPEKARGNQKRMLAIYGLPAGYDFNARPKWTYFSKLSNMLIRNGDGSQYGDVASANYSDTSATHGWSYPKPRVFDMGEYKVYPVSIMGNITASPNYPSSVDGILNSDAMVDEFGLFIDDSNGLYRFINLQEDLAEDISDFDCLTAVNYPWVEPDAFPHPTSDPGWNLTSIEPNWGLDQHSIGRDNDIQWGEARDAMRDSIMQAAYDGVNLWIPEWHMAQHLGFVNTVDIHPTGWWLAGGEDPNGTFDSSVCPPNIAAQNFDRDHLAEGGANWQTTTWIDNRNKNHPSAVDSPGKNSAGFATNGGSYYNWVYDSAGGYYNSDWQVNHFRKVVAAVPDLTDLPTTEMGVCIEGHSWDVFKPNGNFMAHDIVDKPNGLQPGDYSMMWIVDPSDSGDGDVVNHGQSRDVIISARPDGIAGQVVTREMESYWGPNGVQVDNQFKDNAYTIAAEVGTVVRGKAIKGRAFIELMEQAPAVGSLTEDIDKSMWLGKSGKNVSAWDYDERRYLETITVTSVSSKKSVWKTEQIQLMTVYTYYITEQDATFIHHPSPNWNFRGLNWLARKPETVPGESRQFAVPIVVNLSSPAAAFTRTANPTMQVVGTMNLFAEERQPANYRDGNVLEYSSPIALSLEIRGVGRRINPTPITLNLTAPNVAIKAATETLPVYLDSDNTVTLYLKEEN